MLNTSMFYEENFPTCLEPEAAVPSVPVEAVTSVEDFVPDGGVIDKSFLEDAKEVKDSGKTEVNSDSDRWGELSISLMYMRRSVL